MQIVRSRGRDRLTGLFITFEGGEGAGKSTVIEKLATQLRNQGYEIVVTREPGGIRISEQIRHIILHPDHTEMEERTEALLYAAARRQHLIEKVIPALHSGKVVLCDRFIDSSLAYQGYARGIGIEEVLKINKFAINTYMPDLTLYLDISPEEGLRRIRQNENREVNRLDLEALDFHYRVYEGYERVMAMFPERVKRICASQPVEEVVMSASKFVYEKINRKEGDE